MTVDRENIEYDDSSGRWDLHHYGLRVAFARHNGRDAVAITDTGAMGRPFVDSTGCGVLNVAGHIPVLTYEGVTELEYDLAEISASTADGEPAAEIEQEWAYAKAIYAARELVLASPTFARALSAQRAETAPGATGQDADTSHDNTRSEMPEPAALDLLMEAGEKFAAGFALLTKAAVRAFNQTH